jgi:outer membrane lipoprotein-sorting protein
MLVSVLASLTLVPCLVLYWHPRFIFNDASHRPLWQLASVLIIGSGAMLLVANNSHAETLTALTIMQKNSAATKVKDSISDATFTLTNKEGSSRIRKTSGSTLLQINGHDNMRLVHFLSPADIKGTKTLLIEHSMADDDMWIYLPALGKVRRLSASNKKDGFVGTDFSYGDVIGYKSDEWNHKLVREEKVNGTTCYVIESTPISETVQNNSGYSKRLSWIRVDNFVALRVETWDIANQPMKQMLFSEIQQVGKEGRWQAMLSEAENLQTGHRTSIHLDNFRADQGVSERLFTPKELDK